MRLKKLFEVKYLGATNTKGSRIRLTDITRNKSVILPYNYNFNNVLEEAIDFLEKKGIEKKSIAFGELKNSYIIILDDFTIEL